MAYFNRLTEIENRLAALGQPRTDDEKWRSLLRGLTDVFKVPLQVTRALGRGFSEAIDPLLALEVTLQDTISEVKSPKLSSMVTADSYNNKCHHCEWVGHLKLERFYNPESSSYRTTRIGIHQKQRNVPYSSQNTRKKYNRGRNQKHERVNVTVRNGYVTFIVRKCKATSTESNNQKTTNYFIDSGASAHMCNDSELLSTINFDSPKHSNASATIRNRSKSIKSGLGIMHYTVQVDGNI